MKGQQNQDLRWPVRRPMKDVSWTGKEAIIEKGVSREGGREGGRKKLTMMSHHDTKEPRLQNLFQTI